jgi:hypothetical protein
MRKRKFYTELIAAALILLFVYTGINKAMDHHIFALQLQKSPLLSRFSSLIAIILPAFEIMLALALSFYRTRLIALYTATGLLFIFTIYLAFILTYVKQLPCSCGGVISKMSWRQHIIFNLFFLILAVTGIVLQKINNKPERRYAGI